MATQIFEKIDAVFGERSTTIAKDLKLNIRRLIEDSSLSPEEAVLTTIALARATDFDELLHASREAALAQSIAPDVVQEAEENAAIMGMLNIYYRFRHFIEKHDPAAKDEYGAAKLRMTSLANPAMGKEKFEMLAFAVSCINGCEMCVTSHEKALMALGVTREKLHDLGRLAAVMKGLSTLR
ncbi:MAG TPA: carboxymuconolactone decarboxylase family protein [Bdellovibrionales bacterium]|nr:carboxymuconolactone decarboxylase family protein [Bdellovibrionales bacterium]